MAEYRDSVGNYERRVIPVRVPKESIKDKPFVVAYENTDGYGAGTRITEDQFYEILDEYDAVMVQGRAPDHHSKPDRFLLYNEAKEIDVDEEDLDSVTAREQSKELVGDFGWFYHGKHLAVDMSIGLHCLDDDLWEELP